MELEQHPKERMADFAGRVLFVTIFLVCVGVQVVPGLSSSITVSTGDGDPLRQLSYLLAFGAAVVVTRYTSWFVALPLSIILVLAWCWISVMWAIDPGIALRRIVLVTIIAMIIFTTVEAAGNERVINALLYVLLLVLAINYLAVFIDPAAIHPPEPGDPEIVGSWRGLTIHKNFAAPICAFTVFPLIFYAERMPKWLRAAFILATLYFLWRTKSATSIGILVFSVTVSVAYYFAPLRAKRWVFIVLLVMSIMTWLAFSQEISQQIADLLADPQALTGRSEIWNALTIYARDHLLLGSGYGSFWDIGPHGPMAEIVESWVAGLYSGHNGYLDMLVQIGLPGLILCLVAMIVAPLAALTKRPDLPARQSALALGILVFCIGHNLTESGLLIRDLPVSTFLLLAVAMIGKMARDFDRSVATEPANPGLGPAASPSFH